MPVQQQMSSFATRLGGRVAQANVEHRDKPVDVGNRRLPAGIRSGMAKLSAMYTKQQTEDNAKTPKGETFFRASAIALFPEQHNGEKVAGMVTQVVIPLCDVPAKGQRKAQSFSDNWYEFQNFFKLLGISPPVGPQYEPSSPPGSDPAKDLAAGAQVEAYYFAAMKALTDPQRSPTYIEFSTRGWTPPKTPQSPNPEEIVFETWHGLAPPERVAALNGQYSPGAGVTVVPGRTSQPFNEFEPPPQTPPQVQIPSPQHNPVDVTDEVASLVETAMGDPEGTTEDGAAASARLEELAWAAGWTKDQTANPPAPYTNDWAGVGDMALNPPTGAPTAPTAPTVSPMGIPVVGMKYKFAKRTKDGAKLKNNKGEEFPPQEVEVVTVDPAAKTCTLKTAKDGKDVVDIRSKKPVLVKWEWLE